MNEQRIEDIISALYDMVQDARGVPLAADKCIIERDKVLDMLDEVIAQLPVELKQARTIVESRNELIGQARREAETLIRQAQEQANRMVSEEEIYQEAKRQCKEMIAQTQTRMADLRKAKENADVVKIYDKNKSSICETVKKEKEILAGFGSHLLLQKSQPQ